MDVVLQPTVSTMHREEPGSFLCAAIRANFFDILISLCSDVKGETASDFSIPDCNALHLQYSVAEQDREKTQG